MIEEAGNPPVESTSSDCHLAYESSPESKDSELGMVLLTPPSQRSPTPASTVPPPKSAGARQAAPHPVYPPPSLLPLLISLPFFLQRNRTPPPPRVCRLQGTTHLAPSPTPFPFSPTLSLSNHAQIRASIQQCWRSPQPSPHCYANSAQYSAHDIITGIGYSRTRYAHRL